MSTIEYTSENVSYKFSRYRFLNIVRLSTFLIPDIDAWKFALTSCRIACLCETHSLCSLHPDPGLKLLQISWQLLINGVFCTLGRTLCRFFIWFVSMSKMRHLTAGNNTVLQEADDDHCCKEAPGALSTSVKDADFL